MTLFIVSLAVAVLTTVFCEIQARGYEAEYKRRTRVKGASVLGYGTSPEVLKSWFDQGLDLASNFPALVLTLVAFSELDSFRTSLASACLIVAAVVTGVIATMRKDPKMAGGFRLFKVSLFSWLVILLNVVGIVITAISPSG